MIVCIDSGNTRIKWGVHDGVSWLAQGHLGHGDVEQLAMLPAAWPKVRRVMFANVAGEQVAGRIRQALAAWMSIWQPVFSEQNCCGVTNLYQEPGRLGVDRWCALVGAHSLTRQACLVVMAGTATTIDSLDENGLFLGGMILPGIETMRHALAHGTADLPLAQGGYKTYPRCTDDAIATGILEAQLGAVERAYARLPGGEKACLLSGGNASALGAHLVIPFALTDNLPMEGLKAMALRLG